MFQIKTFFKLIGLISVTILMLQCIEVRCKNPTILYNTGKFTGKCRLVHIQKKTKLGLLRLINYPFKISVNDTLYHHKPPLVTLCHLKKQFVGCGIKNDCNINLQIRNLITNVESVTQYSF